MNKRISQFDIVDTLEPDDFIPIVNQQVTKKTQLSAINNIPITFAKETFLPLIGGTVTGNLQVDNDLYVKNNLYTDDTVTVVNLLSTRDHKTSKEWGSAYTAVTQGSASWGSGGTLIQSNSAKWESAYTTVRANSARWETAYTIIEQNADEWNNTLDGTGNSGFISKFLDITEIGNSGIYENIAGDVGIGITTPLNAKLTVNGKIKGLGDLEVAGYSLLSSTHVRGTLRVDGTLSALGGTVNITTVISETSSLKINNFGVGPALSVTQTGAQPVATFSDENGAILCITDGANVGIGPNACSPDPTSKLDVKGALRVDGAKIRTWYTSAELEFDTVKPGVSGPSSSEFGTIFEGIQDGHLLIGLKANDANDGFAIVSKGTTDGYNQFSKYDKNCFTVLNTGKVGIGSRKPTQELHVVGTYLQTIDSSGDYVIKVQDGMGRVNHYWNTLGTTTPTFTRGGESAARWLFGGAEGQNPFEVFISQNGTTQGAGDAITWTKLFTVNRNHYVGIGVDTPSRHLHIANRTAASAEIVLEQANSLADFRKWNFVVDGGSETAGGVRSRFYIRQLNDAGTGGNIPVYIEGNGRVGIGETNPAAQLDVTGNIKMGNLLTTGKGANTLGDDVAIEHGIHRTADGEVYIDFHSTPGTDYNARIFKGATVNGDFSLNNRGTGTFNIIQENASSINLHTSNLNRVTVDKDGNVGVGTSSPSYPLHVVKDGGLATITFDGYINNSDHVGVTCRAARGNVSAPSAVLKDDRIAYFVGGTYGTTGFTNNPVAMEFFASENHTDTTKGSYITFDTTNNGQPSREERLRINSDGKIGVGTIAPNKTLTVVGDISASNIVYDKMEGSNIVPKAGNSMIWNDKIDSDAPIDVSRVGAQSYLNVNIKGSFDGPQSTSLLLPYLITEKDGTVAGLRAGSNGVFNRMYFFTASDNALNNFITTETEYRPPFLAANEYVDDVIDGNQHGIYISIKNTTNNNVKYGWVNINNTLNPAVHTSFIDLTTIANNNSLFGGVGTLTYCKEHNIFITATREQPDSLPANLKTLRYRIYSAGLVLLNTYTRTLGRGGSGANITLTDNVQNTWFEILLVNTSNQRASSLRYSVNGNSIWISDLNEFRVGRPAGYWHVCYNCVFSYNVTNNTFGEDVALPHAYNLNDATTRQAPFFPWRFTNWGGKGFNASLRRDPNNEDIVFETAKYGWASPVVFIAKSYKINSGSTWEDVVRRPYSPNMTELQAGNGTRVPDDASLLGKALYTSYFSSPTKIKSSAESKAPGQDLSTKNVISTISDITVRRGPLLINDWGRSIQFLDTPSEVILDTSSGLSGPIISTLNSANTMRIKRLNGLVYTEINGEDNTVTNNNVITLPNNWETLLDNLLTADANYVGKSSRSNVAYHITGNLFLHTFTYITNSVRGEIYCRLLQYNAATTTVNWLGAASTLLLNQANGSANHTGAWNQSAGIYTAANGTIYMIFSAPGIGTVGGNSNHKFVITINTATNALSNPTEFRGGNGTWHNETVGIHPTFGPYNMYGYVDSYSKKIMFYQNNTGVADLDTRITTCFSDVVNGSALEELGALTIQSATGFLVYITETSVFIRGRQYVLPTGSIDLNNASVWLDTKPANLGNRTIYVYIAAFNKQVKVMFSLVKAANTHEIVYVGTLTTDNTKVVSSNLVSATTIANTIHVNGLTKDITIEGKLNTTKDISTTGKLTSEGGLTLKNSLLSEYTVPVKTVTFAAGSTDYTLTSTDSGGVIVIAAASGANGIIRVPNGFPTGYSVMIVNRSTRTVSVQSAAINGGTVVNVNSKISVGTQYGICNLIYIDSGTALISGDLT